MSTEDPIFTNRIRQGCRIRAYRDVLTACLEKWDRRYDIDNTRGYPLEAYIHSGTPGTKHFNKRTMGQFL